MKKVHRRAWSLVLALVIAMTLLPVSGLAFSWWGEPREESYDAYYYVLLPSFTQGDDSRDPADFNFVGMGSVTDLGPPERPVEEPDHPDKQEQHQIHDCA